MTTTFTQQPGQTAYNGPHALPGTVQAEDFDNGGQNVAYYDSTTENKAATTTGSTAYRPNEYVDAETDLRDHGEHRLDHQQRVDRVHGRRRCDRQLHRELPRRQSWANGRQVVLTVDGAPGCTIAVPNTGSYDAYQTVSAPLALTQGQHVIRLDLPR